MRITLNERNKLFLGALQKWLHLCRLQFFISNLGGLLKEPERPSYYLCKIL